METLLFNQCGSDVTVMEGIGSSSHSKELPSGHMLMVRLPATVYGNFAPIELSNQKRQLLAAKGKFGLPAYFDTQNVLQSVDRVDNLAQTHVVSYPPIHQNYIAKMMPKTVHIIIGGFTLLLFILIIFVSSVIIIVLIYNFFKSSD